MVGLTYSQVQWAARHEWYRCAYHVGSVSTPGGDPLRYAVVCEDRWTHRSHTGDVVTRMATVAFMDYQQLRAWAGY